MHNVLFKNQHFIAIPSFCFRGPWFGIPVLLTIATKFYYVHIFPVTCRSEDSIVCLAKGSAFWQIMGQHNRIRLQNSNWVFMIFYFASFVYLRFHVINLSFCSSMKKYSITKVRIVWEGHKVWKNLPLKIWRCWVASNFNWKIFSNFVAFSEYANSTYSVF